MKDNLEQYRICQFTDFICHAYEMVNKSLVEFRFGKPLEESPSS